MYPSDIFVVGSAKLGFSIVDAKRYRPFGDQSDIDVAVVSGALFDQIWQQVFDYWVSNATLGPKEAKFKEYLFRGWIRPDMLPPSDRFRVRSAWWDFFLGLTSMGNYGPYKIRAGLYKSHHFLEQYHSISVSKCWQELKGQM